MHMCLLLLLNAAHFNPSTWLFSHLNVDVYPTFLLPSSQVTLDLFHFSKADLQSSYFHFTTSYPKACFGGFPLHGMLLLLPFIHLDMICHPTHVPVPFMKPSLSSGPYPFAPDEHRREPLTQLPGWTESI